MWVSDQARSAAVSAVWPGAPRAVRAAPGRSLRQIRA